MDDEVIAAVLRSLRGEIELNAMMRHLEARSASGRGTSSDHAIYLDLWTAAALRQSPARAPYLPPRAVDEVLAERAWLMAEQAWLADGSGTAPEDEAPATVSG